jgi:aspartate-semialdehyde dehydrogenase
MSAPNGSVGGLRVAVVGATGAVGSTMLGIMRERRFPAREVVPFASERSAGRHIDYGDTDLEVRALSPEAIGGFDVALFSAGGTVSSEWAPRFAETGCVVIDNSSAWRLEKNVPLVVAEVNPDALDAHEGIVANPNCSTMQMVMALKPILDEAGIERVVVSTYQSTSGTGQRAVEELHDQAKAVLEADEVEASVYPHQIAFNILPQVERFKDGDDYTTEERKMMAETRKILGQESLAVSATCVRVPVYNAHSESVNVQTRDALSPERCREVLSAFPGVVVVDEPAAGRYPMPIDAAGRDDVLVGRIRRDPSHERCLNMWVVSDNLRKGAATNAVQLAELVLARGLVGPRGSAREPRRALAG